MELSGVRMLRSLLLFAPGEIQEVVVSGPLLAIREDFARTNDLAKSQRGIGIAGNEIGMGAFDRAAKRGPQGFRIIAWQSAEQIVKRFHTQNSCDRSSVVTARRDFVNGEPSASPADRAHAAGQKHD